MGLGLRWDDRDNIFYPTVAVSGRFTPSAPEAGSEPIMLLPGSKPTSGSTPPSGPACPGPAAPIRGGRRKRRPVHGLAQAGGDSLMRGYYAGRYRDRVMAAVQAEYRLPFFGASTPSSSEVWVKSPQPGRSARRATRTSVGAGLRLRVSDEGTNLRMDVGWGHGSRASISRRRGLLAPYGLLTLRRKFCYCCRTDR